jgi:hypothetical protein
MGKKPEANLVAAIRRYLAANGIRTFKIHGGPYQQAGLPDLLCTIKGRTVWIEVKLPGQAPTKIQAATMAALEADGALCFVARSVEDVRRNLSLNLKHGGCGDESFARG